jgi:hypothetical protein
MVHIDSWSRQLHLKLNIYFIDGSGGEEIRHRVLQRLRFEYENREWDRTNLKFGQLVVLCGPKTFVRSVEDVEWSISDEPQQPLPTGCYVLLGIGDFVRENAAIMLQSCSKQRRRRRTMQEN